MSKTTLHALCLLLTLTGFCTHAQNTLSFSSQQANRIDSLLAVLAENRLFNGSVLVAEQGKVVYKKSFGYASVENKVLNSDTTHFNLASVSKPLTSVAVMQWVQKGKLKLDDPLVNYFPDFPYTTVTIRHLLTHTSGLPVLERYTAQQVKEHPDEKISNAKAYADLVTMKPAMVFQPGERWGYNNTNYILLALLVEKLSGMPFATYMKKYVFLPAGMKNTYVRGIDASNTPRYIIPAMYMSDYKNVDSLNHNMFYTHWHLGGTFGPGNVVSTLQDLVQFDNTLQQGKLISKALLDSAFTPVILNNGKTFYMGTSTRSYGLGWNIYHSRKEPVYKYVFHDGHIVGLTTILHRNIDKKQTIIFYDNTDQPPFQIMISINNILNDLPAEKFRLTKSLVRVYGEALVNKGADYAAARFNELKGDTAQYYMDELEMNRLGYDLLSKDFISNHIELSLEAFKINTLLYPKSANAYDSYGDALMKAGQKEAAAGMYTKSLALNPNNDNAKKNLQQLKQ
jgi:CubicO group peptidase (beta-lactamase class C family)